ncbi:MAG: hypothetical protein A3B68_03115 [Candidatus Melainabacteria bacterium RIFCSPHIGHO2_02_FULL_34_12]|nr:MAG: hypothetical protein A3B68_03115 [Candidatus Melainabacteria bacterium RIFCSPHIGHO2_02_FULL_34_12]
MREIVEQFMEQIEDDQKLSSNTKSAYKSDLNDLINYILKTKSLINDIDHNWVKNYLKNLEETNKERNSYNRRASTFRSFLKFLYRNKMAPTNYSLIVDNQTSLYKSKEDELQSEDIKKIIDDTKLKADQRLILLMIGRLNLTGTQIVSLNTFQVDFENKLINISDTEKIELPSHIFLLLREYLLDVRPNIAGASKNLSLFLNEKGKSLGETDIYKLIKKLSEDVGLVGKLTTRNLKKSLDNKNDILSIQKEVLNVISPN